MDVTGGFFGKLRELAVTVEKEVKQLERAMRREDADYEDESSLTVLHDLHGEIKTQKEDVSASLGKICSEKKAVHEFMKASEILMQRNAADLGKIRELFQNYGYKPHVKDSTDENEANSESAMSAQNKSDEEKANGAPHLCASAEKAALPRDPLRNPQLSDFGLSQYAFSRPWSALKAQHTSSARQLKAKSETPLRVQTPQALPKTPKCKLKMDDYECVTPKLEHFGISEHTMCMNEDYTMSLIQKTSQAIKKFVKRGDDNGGNLPEMTIKEIMVTPASKSSKRAENAAAADWMASPMVFVFCTPDVKDSSKTNNTVLSWSPETKELPLPSHVATPQCPDFQTRWLKAEAKQQVTPGGKLESVTKNDAKDTPYKEERIPFAATSDEYLKNTGDPSPPKLEHYDHLLNTPPPPEITKIPDNVLKMLSQYNHKVNSSKSKEMETKAGNTTRYESGSTDYSNKENRGYRGVFKTNI
ncbi:spindle and kinetochore-associated protein 3 isoform X3 [Camarhynchus parvulus]|uniref:spindle and kinetochore-associated protein 3 isoform X3 n=1 Tax=Geospiza parvula TaxID=87175 RepID=UPI001237F45A|nr:spindle and kinetochore-associated protein 3 isoform X3 [Camarhynchus parvulus]